LCGKNGHTANNCPLGEETKRNRGKKSQPPLKTPKTEAQYLCMRCGSRNHKTDHCPNVVIKEHPPNSAATVA